MSSLPEMVEWPCETEESSTYGIQDPVSHSMGHSISEEDFGEGSWRVSADKVTRSQAILS